MNGNASPENDWKFIGDLIIFLLLPWCCVGDLNFAGWDGNASRIILNKRSKNHKFFHRLIKTFFTQFERNIQ